MKAMLDARIVAASIHGRAAVSHGAVPAGDRMTASSHGALIHTIDAFVRQLVLNKLCRWIEGIVKRRVDLCTDTHDVTLCRRGSPIATRLRFGDEFDSVEVHRFSPNNPAGANPLLPWRTERNIDVGANCEIS